MPITYSATLKDSRMNAVVTAIGTSGHLQICTAGYASVLANITLSSTAGTVSSGVLTFSGTPLSGTAVNSGAAAVARIRTSANVDVIAGLTVGVSASDIILDNTSINNGQTVTINSASITHA